MNNWFVNLLPLFLAFPTLTALAGTEVRNGGDAVVCRSSANKILSAELFDYYEGRVLRNFSLKLGNSSDSMENKLELLLSRLALISPLRAGAFKEQADSFFKDTLFLTGQPLVPVHDVDPISVPAGCTIEQLALHREPLFPQDKTYTIDKDIWDQLDNDSKAGLVMHELAFNEARTFGHATSTFARYLNSALASDYTGTLKTQQSVADFFVSLRFAVTDLNGLSLILYSCDPWSSISAQSRLLSFCPSPGEGHPVAVEPLGTAGFTAKGDLQFGFFVAGETEKLNLGNLSIQSANPEEPLLFQAAFYDSHRVRSVLSRETVKADIGGQYFEMLRGVGTAGRFSAVSFYDEAVAQNHAQCLGLEYGGQLPKARGGTIAFPKGGVVLLNKAGQVEKSASRDGGLAECRDLTDSPYPW